MNYTYALKVYIVYLESKFNWIFWVLPAKSGSSTSTPKNLPLLSRLYQKKKKIEKRKGNDTINGQASGFPLCCLDWLAVMLFLIQLSSQDSATSLSQAGDSSSWDSNGKFTCWFRRHKLWQSFLSVETKRKFQYIFNTGEYIQAI